MPMEFYEYFIRSLKKNVHFIKVISFWKKFFGI